MTDAGSGGEGASLRTVIAGDRGGAHRIESQDTVEPSLDRFLRAGAPARRTRVVAAGDAWGPDGRYIIEALLGRGGMGTVHAARDTLLSRSVAIKILDGGDDEATHRARLLREARVGARIEHERIARVYDVAEHDGVLFVAMELVKGTTLRAWLEKPVAERSSHASALLLEVAEGLAVLHEHGLVHRDLKPENVMITERRGIKLLDFGLARSVLLHPVPVDVSVDGNDDPNATTAGTLAGTPAYMAPEQWDGGTIDARADIFAFGIVAYELFVGRRPWRGDSLGALRAATMAGGADLGALVSPEGRALRPVIERALQHAPEQRHADGSALLLALRDALGLRRDGTSPGRRALPRVLRWSIGGALTVAAVAGAAAAWRAWRRPPHGPPQPGMVWIEGGTMTIGRSKSEVDAACASMGSACDPERMPREMPATVEDIHPFQLDIHEVTNEQMTVLLNRLSGSLHVADDDDSHVPRYARFNQELNKDGQFLIDLWPPDGLIEKVGFRFRVKAGHEKEPVVGVTWFGAKLYCESNGKRLPTDTEFEAAARGRENRPYAWGSEPVRVGGVLIPRQGFVPMSPDCPQEFPPLVPVGTSPQDVTPEGVHDLGGSVAEWMDSVYRAGGRGVPGGPNDVTQPRLIRGGSFGDSLLARTSERTWRPPNTVGANVGFRCAAD